MAMVCHYYLWQPLPLTSISPLRLTRSSCMKKLLLASAALLALAMPAQANLVLEEGVFVDLGATGFGNAPRLLNIQHNDSEAGGTFAGAGGTTRFFTGLPAAGLGGIGTECFNNGSCNNQPQVETDKSHVYSIGALGWVSGQSVGIGLDTNETASNAALPFTSLILPLYNSAGTALASFSGNAPVNISAALLDTQQGNGNSVFNIGLDAAQQAQFNAVITANGCTVGVACNTIFEGLSASFGTGLANQVCPPAGIVGGFPSPAGCFGSTDGQESFLAFVQVPGPIAGAGLVPTALGALGLWGFNWRRRKRTA